MIDRSGLAADAAQIIGRYPRPRSALLPLLHLVQAEEGYVSGDGIAFCAEQLGLSEAEVTAVVSFYTLIHVPLEDQRALFPRIRSWLRPGGYLLAITGAWRWMGTEPYLGTKMFWEHADTDTYLRWLQAARLTPQWHRYIPEGDSGHSLILARAA